MVLGVESKPNRLGFIDVDHRLIQELIPQGLRGAVQITKSSQPLLTACPRPKSVWVAPV